MLLSIIILVFNEASMLELILPRVLAVEVGMDWQVVIVDDASSDGTRELYPKLKERYPRQDIVVKLQAVNRGKGAALREGFKHAAFGDVGRAICQPYLASGRFDRYPLTLLGRDAILSPLSLGEPTRQIKNGKGNRCHDLLFTLRNR